MQTLESGISDRDAGICANLLIVSYFILFCHNFVLLNVNCVIIGTAIISKRIILFVIHDMGIFNDDRWGSVLLMILFIF
jgi:hypothetical protein